MKISVGTPGVLKAIAVGALVAATAMTGGVSVEGQGQPPGNTSFHPPVVERAPATELAMKITEPFTFAAVGDMINYNPVGNLADSAYQSLAQVMRSADMTYANHEGLVIDLDTFKAPLSGQVKPKAALEDLKALGIRIMTTSNNHTMDSGAPGMFETNRLLDEAGIVHAGAGANLQEARQARLARTPKGRVGVVGMFSIGPEQPATQSGAATYKEGTVGGQPGVNPLRVQAANIVTAEQMQALRKIRDAVYARRSEVPAPLDDVRANEPQDRLQLFNTNYQVGDKVGNLAYTINPRDLNDMLLSIRDGKVRSDFMIVAIHCHQNSFAFQAYSHDNQTPDFLVELAHKAIDNGADVFVGHGVHTLRGVEIYKGKPIFYGVSNFFNQLGQEALAPTPGGKLSATEEGAEQMTWVTQDSNLEALLTTSRFEGGKLVEVRLYPADLGQGHSRPLSKTGVPMTPSPATARKILEKMQAISKPFGTTIAIENNIGVIRVATSTASR